MTATTVANDERRGTEPPGPRRLSSGKGLYLKLAFVALIDAFALAVIPRLLSEGENIAVALVVIAAAALNYIYLSNRSIPAKYLAPGTIFLLVFMVYPVLYTAFLSFTNFGTGNIISKDQAIEQILDRATVAEGESREFQMTVLTGPDDELALYLVDENGQELIGTTEGLEPLEPGEATGSGADLVVGDRSALSLIDASERQQEILDFEVPTDTGVITPTTFTAAGERVKSVAYDAERDVMVRVTDGTEFTPVEGRYTSLEGETLEPGWRTGIGFQNYERLFTDSSIRGPFLRVFVWTFAFAFLSVAFTLALGLALAMTLNDVKEMRGRRLYRSLLIIPYALPSFMSALIWAGLLNQDFGVINRMLSADIAWLADPWLAKFSVLLVNLWLGFPYMLLIATGALQSIPDELMEAASVDGAGPWQRFQRIRFPLLMTTIAPLLIASFAFNFNNFNVIFLVNRGGPPIAGAETPAGHTDILISYTYRLAFEGGRGQDFAFAAAISVIIFILVATISAISFRRTKAFEELYA